jgi:diguanylate cyclase (GGDEF)-like protein
MNQNQPSLAVVTACLEERGRMLSLPPALEEAFEKQAQGYRASLARTMLLPTLVIYNLFLIVDWLVLPQTFVVACILHLAVVSPLVLLSAWIVSRRPRRWLREAAEVSVPLAMAAQILFIFTLNSGQAADQYQYLTIMILVFMNISQRLHQRAALLATILMTVLYLTVLMGSASEHFVKLVGAASMIAAALVTSSAAQRMAHDARYMFLRRLQDRLRREEAETDAAQDPLTGLSNRRALERSMERQWNLSDKESCLALVMIDLDHFKAYNDHYGHPAGDLCLKRVATILAEALRAGDLAARIGGEEFVVLLPETDLVTAVRIAERIRRAIEAASIPHEARGPGGVMTASLGVLAGARAQHTPGELMAGADAALYAAKRTGRNRVWPPFLEVGGTTVPITDGRWLSAGKR